MEFKGLKDEDGYKVTTFSATPAEIESARLGLIGAGARIDELPYRGRTNPDKPLNAGQARLILAGNLALLQQMAVSSELVESNAFSAVSMTVNTGLDALRETATLVNGDPGSAILDSDLQPQSARAS